MGDRANGRLSEAERADVARWIRRYPLMADVDWTERLTQVVERIVREHTERAWDEAHDAFCPRTIVCSTHGRPGDRHRIYAARQEQS